MAVFPPCPDIRPLTPHNLVRPLIGGYFDYTGFKNLRSPQGHPAYHGFLPL